MKVRGLISGFFSLEPTKHIVHNFPQQLLMAAFNVLVALITVFNGVEIYLLKSIDIALF